MATTYCNMHSMHRSNKLLHAQYFKLPCNTTTHMIGKSHMITLTVNL